jgi:predicted transcriptional regulator
MTDGLPDIVETVSDESVRLEKTLRDLRELNTAVESYQDRVESMDETERELFYQGVESIRTEIAETTDPAALLALQEAVEETVRSPLQQVARESLTALLGRLQPDLDEDARTQVYEQLEAKVPEDLQAATDAYQDLYARVGDFDSVLVTLVAAVVESQPSILVVPRQELLPVVEDLETRHATLESLEAEFGGIDCVPSLEFTGVERFYDDGPDDIDVASIRADLEHAESALETLKSHGIDVRDVVKTDVSEVYDEAPLSELVQTISDTRQTVTTAAETYGTVVQFMTTLGNYDHTEGPFDSEVDDLHKAYSSLQEHDYATVEYLSQSVDEMTDRIDQFAQTVSELLEAQHELVEELAGSEATTASTPESRFQTSPLRQRQIRNDPVDALTEYAELHDWLRSELDADLKSVDQESLFDLWQSLTKGNKVEITEDNQDAVLALANRLSVSVILTSL